MSALPTTRTPRRRAPEVVARAITVRVRGRATAILESVELTAPAGQVTGLLGPNGSGKSTLLRRLAGTDALEGGVVLIGGRDLTTFGRTERARIVALMEQSGETDTDLAVEDVAALGRIPHRSRLAPPGTDDVAACASALSAVGLAGMERRRWHTLSGGERQRAHLARVLAQQPAVVLLDEPTNHLDLRHQHGLLTLLRATPATVIIVLHDLALAARYCDHLVVLREGRVHTQGAPLAALTPTVLDEVFGVRAEVSLAQGRPSLEVHGASAPPGTDPSVCWS